MYSYFVLLNTKKWSLDRVFRHLPAPQLIENWALDVDSECKYDVSPTKVFRVGARNDVYFMRIHKISIKKNPRKSTKAPHSPRSIPQ